MPKQYPPGKEQKRGFTISIEHSWKNRFIIACFNKGQITGNQIVPSSLVRKFIIDQTEAMEKFIDSHEK